jgi:hypothetical protein
VGMLAKIRRMYFRDKIPVPPEYSSALIYLTIFSRR